jgi:alkylhydroperoxidase family enzyme
MAFINQIQPDAATGKLARIYQAAIGRVGHVANIIKIMSQHPDSCEGSMSLYVSIMKTNNDLDAATREMLATVVSHVNDCFY